MKKLILTLLAILLLSMLFGCSTFRKQNPLNVECPSCGYIWERSPGVER